MLLEFSLAFPPDSLLSSSFISTCHRSTCIISAIQFFKVTPSKLFAFIHLATDKAPADSLSLQDTQKFASVPESSAPLLSCPSRIFPTRSFGAHIATPNCLLGRLFLHYANIFTLSPCALSDCVTAYCLPAFFCFTFPCPLMANSD